MINSTGPGVTSPTLTTFATISSEASLESCIPSVSQSLTSEIKIETTSAMKTPGEPCPKSKPAESTCPNLRAIRG